MIICCQEEVHILRWGYWGQLHNSRNPRCRLPLPNWCHPLLLWFYYFIYHLLFIFYHLPNHHHGVIVDDDDDWFSILWSCWELVSDDNGFFIVNIPPYSDSNEVQDHVDCSGNWSYFHSGIAVCCCLKERKCVLCTRACVWDVVFCVYDGHHMISWRSYDPHMIVIWSSWDKSDFLYTLYRCTRACWITERIINIETKTIKI